MKTVIFFLAGVLILVTSCNTPPPSRYSQVASVENGTPVSVMLTTYSTTMLANGEQKTWLRVCFSDSLSREIVSADDSVRLYVDGVGKVTDRRGKEIVLLQDTSGAFYAPCKLNHGYCLLQYIAGNQAGKVKIEARSGNLWPGGHEIHLVPADFELMTPVADQLTPTIKSIDRMIGADISWLPQLEDRGIKFFDEGTEKDPIILLKDHGFNCIRLRIFVNPENEKGYAPWKGYCGLSYTLAMAKRVYDAGMKLLLDYHYSDYWADPQQQNKPAAWTDLGFEALKDSVRIYTSMVLNALSAQGTPPAMVQIGNEINHGILWPEGHISQPWQLAELLKSGVAGVRAVNPELPVMMHIALGGQNEEAVFWLDNMIARGVEFDIIGLSYYPRWHGTLDDLNANLNDLTRRYHKSLNVVEYSDFKKEVNEMVFSLEGGMGKGTAIWEPLNFRSGLFDREGNATELFKVYDEINSQYLMIDR